MKPIFPNPFTADRIRELYCERKMTGKQIAEFASEVMEWPVVPHENTAMSWVKSAGITPRSSSENRKIYHQKNPEHKEQTRVLGHSRKGQPMPTGAGRSFAAWTEEDRNKATAKRCERLRVKAKRYPYSCRVCGTVRNRLPCQMKGKRFSFCSNSCVREFNLWYRLLPDDFKAVLPHDVDEEGYPK